MRSDSELGAPGTGRTCSEPSPCPCPPRCDLGQGAGLWRGHPQPETAAETKERGPHSPCGRQRRWPRRDGRLWRQDGLCGGFSGGAALLPPCRAAEKQARGGHRKASVPERPMAPEQLSDKWPVSKEGSKQVRTGGRQEGGPAGAAPSGGLCLRVPPRGSAGSALSALPASAAWAGQTGPWGVPQDATCAPRPTPAGAQRG